MKLFKSIKHRFYLIVGLLLILFSGGCVQLVIFLNGLAERSENRRAAAFINREITDIQSACWRLRFWGQVVRTQPAPDAEKTFYKTFKRIEEKLEALSNNPFNHQWRGDFTQVIALLAEYKAMFIHLMRNEVQSQALSGMNAAFDTISAQLIDELENTAVALEAFSYQNHLNDADLLQTIKYRLAVSFLAAFILFVLIFDMIARKVITPIRQMSEVVAQVKSGNDQARFESTARDEIAELGFVFNEILDTINDQRERLETKIEESTTEVLQTNEELILEIVERKHAEEETEEALREAKAANQAKSTFLANMSHELRTPLNAILGYAQILQREASVNKHQRNGLNIIHKSGQHLLMLLNDILDLSKIEAGRMEIQTSEFYLAPFLNNIVDIFRLRSEQKMIRFNHQFASNLPISVIGDEIRLRQVLINLLGNAVKFTQKGFVTFEAAISSRQDVQCAIENCKASKCIRFTVRDTGVGITPEDMKTIFKPFHRADSKPNHTEGTGLGLSISKKLIGMMGGRLEVKSDVERGSLFSVDVAFGITDTPSAIPKPKHIAVTGYTGPQRKILIADDNPENRSVLRYMLTPLHFGVIEARNGQEALEKMQTLHPDVILMDMVMPVSDGFEATQKIRHYESRLALPVDSKPLRTPIIAITAKAFINDKQKCLDAGCDDFIPKPVNVDELLEKLQRHLTLDWIYEDTQPEAVEFVDNASPIVPPGSKDLKLLIESAQVGDIRSIRKRAGDLEKADPRMEPFARRLKQLAEQFQIDKIRKMLNSFEGDIQ